MKNKHAAALGRLNKGVKKNLTLEQRAVVAERLALYRYRGGRKLGAKNCQRSRKPMSDLTVFHSNSPCGQVETIVDMRLWPKKPKHPTGLHDMDGFYKTADGLREKAKVQS